MDLNKEEKKISTSGDLFKYALDFINKPVILFSEAGELLTRNQQAEHLFGNFTELGFDHFSNIFDESKNSWKSIVHILTDTNLEYAGYNFLHHLDYGNTDHLPVEVNIKRHAENE